MSKPNSKSARQTKRKAGKPRGRPSRKKTILLREKKTVKQEVPVIHVSDIDQFVKKVVEVRELPNKESLLIKIGIDEGQKLLKICLSVIHLLGESDPDKKVFEQKNAKDSGVKKVFIVGVTPAKETHSNLKTLLLLIRHRLFLIPSLILLLT